MRPVWAGRSGVSRVLKWPEGAESYRPIGTHQGFCFGLSYKCNVVSKILFSNISAVLSILVSTCHVWLLILTFKLLES